MTFAFAYFTWSAWFAFTCLFCCVWLHHLHVCLFFSALKIHGRSSKWSPAPLINLFISCAKTSTRRITQKNPRLPSLCCLIRCQLIFWEQELVPATFDQISYYFRHSCGAILVLSGCARYYNNKGYLKADHNRPGKMIPDIERLQESVDFALPTQQPRTTSRTF